jgi:hypothetical protein
MLMERAGAKWEAVRGSLWQVRGNQWKRADIEIDEDSKVMKALEQVENDIPVSEFSA